MNEQQHKKVFGKVQKWCAERLEVGTADKPDFPWKGCLLTPREVFTEVEAKTETGCALVEHILDLAVDHIVSMPLD